MADWLKDDNGNRCSIKYFGSEEAAQKALDSLIDCENCINCSDCSYCWRCSNCTGCSLCSDCSDCSLCSDCTSCSRCSNCSDCSKKIGNLTSSTVPIIEDIHKRVYAAASGQNALEMSKWHTCDSTHCWAGWVVHLAGVAGYALERFHNTALAAQLIYKASGYKINPGRFYVNKSEALEDMRILANARKK